MANLRAPRIDIVWIASLLLAGCAASSAQPPARDTVFRRIQRHEAVLQQSFAEADQPEVTCARRCTLMRRASESAVVLCDLARDIDDTDALARCERGARTADALKQRVTAECRCDDEKEASSP